MFFGNFSSSAFRYDLPKQQLPLSVVINKFPHIARIQIDLERDTDLYWQHMHNGYFFTLCFRLLESLSIYYRPWAYDELCGDKKGRTF